MPRLRAHNISVSLDGFMAGPAQSLDNPLGVGGERLHDWAFATRTWRRLHGMDDGTDGGMDDGTSGGTVGGATELDERSIAAGVEGIGATIMGRNMFGPVRGPWDGDAWTGWWGEDPPFHHPVFVLTHHARAAVPMAGGTTFHFVTAGERAALDLAFEAAGGLDVRVGGGAATLRTYLRAGLLDELHLAIAPVLLGAGERLFEHLDDLGSGYRCVELAGSPAVLHARIARIATT